MTYSDNAWKQAIAYQIEKLNEFVYIGPNGKKRKDVKVIVRGSQTSTSFPPFKTYHDDTYAWKTAGYEDIDIQLKCPGIISTDPQNKRSPYKLNMMDLKMVKIQEKFDLKVYFPRGYPEDKIAWGIFFSEPIHKIPSYPNISKRRSDTDDLNFFSDYPPYGSPELDGMICLGVATAAQDIVTIFQDLVRYLLLDNKGQFTRQSDPSGEGFNDGGFDGGLLDHYQMNFDNFKKLIDDFKGTGSISFKKKTNERISFKK